MKTLLAIFLLSSFSCSNDSKISKKESRRMLLGQLFTYSLLTGILDTSPDLCGEDKNKSTLIGAGFTSSGILTDTLRTIYYSVPEDSNATHTIKLQTLSANCDSIAITFDNCKYNKKKFIYDQQCNPAGYLNGNKSSGGVKFINGIQNIECSVKSNPALTYIQIENNAKTTAGGCQWSFQFSKN